ncbi:MAG TPA: matrixin family metalloprotease [Mycobacteriales bacterium]|nr:matrixin family metalloprotease [Mycobacteriales bacterium]
MLVAWTDPSRVSRLDGAVIGLGGDYAIAVNGHPRAVTGIVYLDAPDLARMAQSARGRNQVRAVILHELGHLVGLGHVPDRGAIMYPESLPGVWQFSAGDLRGLAAAGRDDCAHLR